MLGNTKKSKKGIGLAECVVALLIFSIVTTGAISVVRYANKANETIPDEYRSYLTANNVLSCFQCAEGTAPQNAASKFESYLEIESIADTELDSTVKYEIPGDDNYYEFSPDERTVPFEYDYIKYFPKEKVLEFIKGGVDGTTKLTQNNVVLFSGSNNLTFPELTNTKYFKQEKACTGSSSYSITHTMKLQFSVSDSQYSSLSWLDRKKVDIGKAASSGCYIDVTATYTYDDEGYKLIWNYYANGFNGTGDDGENETASFSCNLNNCNYEKNLIKNGRYLQFQKIDGFGDNDVTQYYYFKVMDSKNTSDTSDDTLVEYIKIELGGESADGDPSAGATKSVTVSHLGNSITNSVNSTETSNVSSLFIFLRKHSMFKWDKLRYYRILSSPSDWTTAVTAKQDSSYEYSVIKSSGFAYNINYVLHNGSSRLSVFDSGDNMLYQYNDSSANVQTNLAKFQASPCRFTKSSSVTLSGTTYTKWYKNVTQSKAGSVSFDDANRKIIFKATNGEPMFTFEYGTSTDEVAKYNNEKNSIIGFNNQSEYKDLYSYSVSYTPKTAQYTVQKTSKAEFDAIKKLFTDAGKSSYLSKADTTEKAVELTANVLTKVSYKKTGKKYTYTVQPFTCTATLTYKYDLTGFTVKREQVAVTYSGGTVSYSTKETYTPIFKSTCPGEPTYTVTQGSSYEVTSIPSGLWFESNIQTTVTQNKNSTFYYRNVEKGSYSSQNEAARAAAKADVEAKFKSDYKKANLNVSAGTESNGTAYPESKSNSGSRSVIEAELKSKFDVENTTKWTKTLPTSATFTPVSMKYRSDTSENPHEWIKMLSNANVLYFDSTTANLTVDDVTGEEGVGGVEEFKTGPSVSTELTSITRYYKYMPSGQTEGCLIEATFSDMTYQSTNEGVTVEPRINIWIIDKEGLDAIVNKQTLKSFIESHSPDISYRKG